MDKEALKALGLTDEQVVKIHEDYGKNYVTKAQFNERAGELKHEKEEREKTAKALDELKKQHESNADFQKQIAVSPCGNIFITNHAKRVPVKPSSGGNLPVDGRRCPEGADDGRLYVWQKPSMRYNFWLPAQHPSLRGS